MVKLCGACNAQRAVLKRPKTGDQVRATMLQAQFAQRKLPSTLQKAPLSTPLPPPTPCLKLNGPDTAPCADACAPAAPQLCRECFYATFEAEVHDTILSQQLFRRGERVAVAASGGKDSTVLAHVLTTLNRRHDYGLDLVLLSIDEGIAGYRDDSLETVKRNEVQYGIPLKILSYKELYGWSMDEIVKQIGGLVSNVLQGADCFLPLLCAGRGGWSAVLPPNPCPARAVAAALTQPSHPEAYNVPAASS